MSREHVWVWHWSSTKGILKLKKTETARKVGTFSILPMIALDREILVLSISLTEKNKNNKKKQQQQQHLMHPKTAHDMI